MVWQIISPQVEFIKFVYLKYQDVEAKRREIDQYSYKFPAHLAQHRLANILHNELGARLDANDKLLVNTEFAGFQEGNFGEVKLFLCLVLKLLEKACSKRQRNK